MFPIPRRQRTPQLLAAVLVAAALCSGGFAFAEDASWKDLERGKVLYAQRKFGEALLTFNRAVAERNEGFKRKAEILDSVLATRQAKRADGSISRLIDLFAEEDLRRGEIDAIKADSGGYLSREIEAYGGFRISDPFQNLIDVLRAALDFRSQEYFGDSLAELRAFIASRRFFPEAEYWIAMVFLAEGEYEIAQKQLEKTLGYSASLDLPEFAHEVRYLLAGVHKTKKNLAAMETVLGEIVSQDALFSSEARKSLREAMKRSLVTDGIDKFLTLYRHDAFYASRAYAQLGEYYYKSGRYSRAIDHLMLAACVLSSRIVQGLIDDDLSYRYSNLSDLLARIGASERISSYAQENGYERVLYYLGTSLQGEGRTEMAKDVFRGLSSSPSQWGRLSREQLRKPFMDKAEEDPEF